MKNAKSILLLLACVCAAGSAKGQYASFFGDSITTYRLAVDCISYDPYALGGADMILPEVRKCDTVRFNGNLYYRTRDLYAMHNTPLVREDTTAGQILVYDSFHDVEYCICDMSLSVGDTFFAPFISCPIVADSVTYEEGKKVIFFKRATDYFYYCDYQRYDDTNTVIYLKDILPIMFIEGIGPTYGVYDKTNNFHYAPVMLCMYKDGTFVFALDEDWLGCEQDCLVSVRENTVPSITVYPNPAKRNLTVKLDDSFAGNGTLLICDAVGRVVLSKQMSNRTAKINVSNLQSGIYVALYMENGRKFSQKFVKR